MYEADRTRRWRNRVRFIWKGAHVYNIAMFIDMRLDRGTGLYVVVARQVDQRNMSG